ncbi:MAG: amino acid adenylation domain-containing protein [Verrucomicrobiales bacterium]|jgi:amino acid adenylation domain-containing protein
MANTLIQKAASVPRSAVESRSILRSAVEHARLAPDTIAFRDLGDGNEERANITFGQLVAGAAHFGDQLRASRKMAKTDAATIAVLQFDPGLDYITALFGCWWADVTAVPAYLPRSSRHSERLSAILHDCHPDFVLTSSSHVDRVSAISRSAAPGAELLEFASENLALLPDRILDVAIDATFGDTADPALIQYTSGSTGSPKGVVVSHANLLHNVEAILHGLPDKPTVSVSWLPPYHDMGLVSKILLPVHAGIEAVLLSPFGFMQRPSRWLKAISDYGGSFSGAPDSAYDLCCRRITDREKRELDLSSWKVAFNGSEPVRGNTVEKFSEQFRTCGFRSDAIWPVYGLAEATLCVTQPRSAGMPRSVARKGDGRTFVSCGAPVDGMTVRIIKNGSTLPEPAADMEEGEIWISGPSVTRGYYNQADATDRVFQRFIQSGRQENFLRSGDLGFLSKGELFVTGRVKNVLIFNGQNYHPEDIERTIEQCHPALHVGGVAAFACQDASGREQLALALEVPHRETQDYKGIARTAREAAGIHFDLRSAVVVCVRDWRLPRTTSGKIQRRACAKLFNSGWQGALYIDDIRRDRQTESSLSPAPAHILSAVCATMEEVFGITGIKADTDFFELGGHSLTATRVTSRLSAKLKVEIPIRLVFEAPTPNQLAAAIASECQALDTTADSNETAASDISQLTPSQRRMWFLHVADPKGSAYNVGGALGVEGEFDATIAVAAFRKCLEAHPILRATYQTDNGLPLQRISPPEESDLGGIIRDYRGLDDAKSRVSEEITNLTQLPFDLVNGPLYRFRVYQLAPKSHVLAVSFHHIVVDGWAVGILIRDLFRFYTELQNGELSGDISITSNLPSLPPVSTSRIQSQLDYWKTTLKGAQDSLDLPVDYTTPRTDAAGGALCKIPFSPALLEALQNTAKSNRSTLFIVLLTGFQILLARYARQRDFLIGVPVANRKQLESEDVIASMVNTLPYRADMSDDPTLPDLLTRVRNTVLDMQDNQDAPLEDILNSMERSGRSGSSPFRVMFDYQEIPLPKGGPVTFNTDQWESHRGSAQFDLSLFVSDLNGAYVSAIEYRPALFNADTVERMGAHFVNILWQLAEINDTAAIAPSALTLPLLTIEERQAILYAPNDTALPLSVGENLLHDIAHQADRNAEATAVSCGDFQFTYSELDSVSNRIARLLQSENIGTGDSVAVYLKRSAEMVAVFLGILKSGACYIPLDPEYPSDRIAMILEDASPGAVITQTDIAHNITGSRTLLIDDSTLRDRLNAISDAPVDNTISPDDIAYVIFTSGSTGRPKGVEIPHRGLHNFLHSMAIDPGLDQGDTLLAVTTIAFDISGLEMFLPLICGARVHITQSNEAHDGRHLIDCIESLDITHLQATPATWQLLITNGWQGKRAGRPLKMLCGGEELPKGLAAQLVATGGELWNLYGPTETTIWSTIRLIKSANTISIGRPIANTQCYVLDDHLEPVPTGVAGELFIGGDGVAAGYHKRPDLTEERFVADPFAGKDARMYRTGDLARYDAKGELHYLGRLDHQVKVRGHRIELGEIATALDSHPSVRRSVVTAPDLPGLGKSLVAYCEPDQAEISTDELLNHVRKVLPAYMVPAAIVVMDALPQTPNGKIDRKQLPMPEAATSTDYTEPTNELERRICEIWADVLRIPKVGIRDDFFVLGGHSLLAAQAFVRMNEELGIDLPLNALFERATVAALAERWERGNEGNDNLPKGVVRLYEPKSGTAIHPTTLLWIHPLGGGGGGGLLSYREMARNLNAVRSYGIREAGETYDTLGEMAQRYAERLNETAPDGPVALAGFCFGGNLALEIATRMKAMGRPVEDVFLLDARPGASATPRDRRKVLGAVKRLITGSKADRQRLAERAVRDGTHRLKNLIVGGECRQYIPDLEEILNLKEYPESYREIARHHWLLLHRHSISRYDGITTLLRSTQDNPADFDDSCGWAPYTSSLIVATIQGQHEEFLRSATMMQQVSTVIREHLKLSDSQ